ncbi:hypothetical protein DFH08DRAFT_815364 [Mycena albidolilacea]|uniref:Uncharacterized protein n=1 Tax=Mycena albidolilacea TaxID=1033008 RepID=A0AAD6ZN52_9AGAR|nr:hypothetical protein DFH08DRAFT_815364 [Mycena albidolilacea]
MSPASGGHVSMSWSLGSIANGGIVQPLRAGGQLPSGLALMCKRSTKKIPSRHRLNVRSPKTLRATVRLGDELEWTGLDTNRKHAFEQEELRTKADTAQKGNGKPELENLGEEATKNQRDGRAVPKQTTTAGIDVEDSKHFEALHSGDILDQELMADFKRDFKFSIPECRNGIRSWLGTPQGAPPKLRRLVCPATISMVPTALPCTAVSPLVPYDFFILSEFNLAQDPEPGTMGGLVRPLVVGLILG